MKGLQLWPLWYVSIFFETNVAFVCVCVCVWLLKHSAVLSIGHSGQFFLRLEFHRIPSILYKSCLVHMCFSSQKHVVLSPAGQDMA